jgi:hypothetical protein
MKRILFVLFALALFGFGLSAQTIEKDVTPLKLDQSFSFSGPLLTLADLTPKHQTFSFLGSRAELLDYIDKVCVGDDVTGVGAKCVSMATLMDWVTAHGEESK